MSSILKQGQSQASICYKPLSLVLCFVFFVGHVTVGAVTLDVFSRKASNDKIARVGFTLGFDRFHVCSYTAISSPRVKKKLEPGIVGKRRCKQRQIVAQKSKVRA